MINALRYWQFLFTFKLNKTSHKIISSLKLSCSYKEWIQALVLLCIPCRRQFFANLSNHCWILYVNVWFAQTLKFIKAWIDIHSFVLLGFSSNVTSDTVTLTNFVKNSNFCGRLCCDSLVAKPSDNFSVLSLRAADNSLTAPQMKLTRL